MRDGKDLSERETQLLELAAAGLTDTAISNRLGISEATVSTYWGRIRAKIGPYSRTELVATVLKEQSEAVLSKLREENERLAHRLKLETGETAGANFYKLLLEEAGDAILIVSHLGTIEMLNESAANLFGWEPGELQGQHISMILPERYRRAHSSHVRDYIAAPAKRRMGDHLATPGLHRSGREVQISASLSAIGEGDERSVICIVRPVERH